MTSIEARPAQPRRTPGRLLFLFAFHAALSGAFVVAYLTGDEDTYAMHQFAGYTALAALAVRLLAGVLMPVGPLRLPRPSLAATLDWLRRVASGDARAWGQRSPLLAWMALALLAVVGAAALSGAVADAVVPMEKLHEALGEFSLPVVLAHVALVVALLGLKKVAGWRARSNTRHEVIAP
ncbi:cytochrome b [Azospirillum brasilense]|nr:cytochrome b [Azospirillum brasilense]